MFCVPAFSHTFAPSLSSSLHPLPSARYAVVISDAGSRFSAEQIIAFIDKVEEYVVEHNIDIMAFSAKNNDDDFAAQFPWHTTKMLAKK